MKPNAYVSAQQCKICGKTPLLDLGLFLGTKLLPIYLAGAALTAVMVVGLAVVGIVQKIIEGFIKGYVIDNCLESAIRSHTPYKDQRITVASATESPTERRVRKRVSLTPMSTFEPGGGHFGGAGAGADWNDSPLIEPLTGLPLDWNLGTSFEVRPTESRTALQMGTATSRPLSGYMRTNVDHFGNETETFVNRGAMHEISEVVHANGVSYTTFNRLWLDNIPYGLQSNSAFRSV